METPATDRLIALAGSTRVGSYRRKDGTKVSSYTRGKISGIDVETVDAGSLRRGDLIHESGKFQQVLDSRVDGDSVRLRMTDSDGRKSIRRKSVTEKVKRVILGVMTAAVAAMVFGADLHDVGPVAPPIPNSQAAVIGEDGDDADYLNRLLKALSHQPKK